MDEARRRRRGPAAPRCGQHVRLQLDWNPSAVHAALRAGVQGVAVALVKAAVGARYGDAGKVRPPLLHPGDTHARRLADLVDSVLALARSDVC